MKEKKQTMVSKIRLMDVNDQLTFDNVKRTSVNGTLQRLRNEDKTKVYSCQKQEGDKFTLTRLKDNEN